MNTPSSRRRITRTVPLVWLGVLLAVSSSGGALAAGSSSKAPSRRVLNLAGRWSGRYGGAFSGTFKLHWTQSGSSLRGSITLSKPSGTYSVTGTVRGSAIRFGAVGAGATYTGSVTGKAMSGSYKTPAGGGSWSARKTS